MESEYTEKKYYTLTFGIELVINPLHRQVHLKERSIFGLRNRAKERSGEPYLLVRLSASMSAFFENHHDLSSLEIPFTIKITPEITRMTVIIKNSVMPDSHMEVKNLPGGLVHSDAGLMTTVNKTGSDKMLPVKERKPPAIIFFISIPRFL